MKTLVAVLMCLQTLHLCLPHGLLHSGSGSCKVCKHINAATKIFSNHQTVKPGNYNRDSAIVVYLIHCQKCPEAQYIGETGGNLDTDVVMIYTLSDRKTFFLCHCTSMQMITALMISKFAF